MVRKVLILTIIVLAMSACGRAPGTPARIPQASDSLYTAQAALKVYGTQPDQALAIIDSALVIGNVSPFRADFLRAMVYANSVERPQLNKAISLCENLLKQDSTQVVDKPTFDNRNNVLGVMLDACRKKEDDENWLRYAVERAELSRAHGMETEALRMEAGIVARKRRIMVFEEVGRFRDMIPDPQAFSYLDRYTRLQTKLNDKRFESEALEYAARYHAMEQEQKLRETESESARLRRRLVRSRCRRPASKHLPESYRRMDYGLQPS